MNYVNAVTPVAAPTNEDQPLANTKPELAALSDLELLLCGGGEGTVCW